MTEESAFTTLAAKLRTLDLSVAEQAAFKHAMEQVHGRTEPAVEDEPEVEGFAVRAVGDLGFKVHKKEFKGSDEELQAIVDWLGSLEAQE